MRLEAGAAPASLSADVCVVGAGPAGLTLARELTAHGRTVVVLESGNGIADPAVQELNQGEQSGDPYQALETCRQRGFGGTTAIWNTWFEQIRWAKYVPLDEIDFTSREWMPWSGWPFPLAALEPYYRRAAALSGSDRPEYQVGEWNTAGLGRLDLDSGGLRNAIYQYGPASIFTEELPQALITSGSGTLLAGATLTGLERNPGGERVTAALWQSLSGRGGRVEAHEFVLAAGAIENPRLLLLHLGERPWLGRGFMEHPVDGSLQLVTRHAALLQSDGFYTHRRTAFRAPVLGRIGLTEELQRRERLGNATLRFLLEEEPGLLQSSSARASVRRFVPARRLRRIIGNAVRVAARAIQPVRGARFQILIDLEQGPHPENRVLLSDRRDRFGLRQARLHWEFREADRANHGRMLDVVTRELERARAGRVVRRPEPSIDPKHHHHAGTTRMHQDRGLGVVDAQLRVHGMENLYVTGASVFPTAGFANPTLTVVALSLRLADFLLAHSR